MLNNVIDISHHNTVIGFQQIKDNGIVGVFHKATQGGTIVDAKYHSRRQRALDAGLLWGAYHFGTKGNVEEQVENFFDTVNPSKTDLLVLDFEPNDESGTMTFPEAEKFVTPVKQKPNAFPDSIRDNPSSAKKSAATRRPSSKTVSSGSPDIQANTKPCRPLGKHSPSGNTPTAMPVTNLTKSPASDAATATDSTVISKVCKGFGALS